MTQTTEPLPAVAKQLTSTSTPDSYGLKTQVLSPLETLGQSVANIAPTGTPTVVIPLVFAAAGSGTWLAYALAIVGVSLVSFSINVFARRSASPGSLYTYAATGLGPAWGTAVGWALFIAYTACASSVTTGFANYVNVLLRGTLGLDSDLPTASLVGVIAASVVGSWYVAHKDVRLSARLMLGFELASVSFILLVVVASLVHNGLRLDTRQFTLEGLTLPQLRLGLVFAIFSFTGFESATSLGVEAKSPLRTIPRAVWQSALFVGILFVISSYAEVLGFAGHSVSLDKSNAPLQVLASDAGVPFLGILITIGAIISFFACVLASINAGSRVLFLMSRHGLLHGLVGNAHQANETPHVAVAVSSIVALLPAATLAAAGLGMFDIYGLIGTTATLGFMVSYIAVSVAAPIYLHRRGELRLRHTLVSGAAIAFMLVAFVGAVYPLPEGPARYPVYAFFALLGLGALWGALRVRAARGSHSELGQRIALLEARYQNANGT